MRRSLTALAVLAGVAVFLRAEDPPPETVDWGWQRDGGNPVLRSDSIPAAEGALYPVLGDPSVLIEGGRWRMWFGYGGLDDAANEQSLAVRTALAESEDGRSWKVVGTALDKGSEWDRTNAETPCVIVDESVPEGSDGRYRMYYAGMDQAVEKQGFEKLLEVGMGYGIGLAFSKDGRTFTRIPAEESPHKTEGLVLKPNAVDLSHDMWDFIHVADPHVLKHGGLWHMWYTSFALRVAEQKTFLAVAYATSKDGIRWEKHGHVLKADQPWELERPEPHVGRPCVIRRNDRFEMFYDAVSTDDGHHSRGVGFAWSKDGKAWTKAGAPVFSTNDGPGELKGLMIGTAAFHKDGVWHLFYGGFDPDGEHTVFNLATSKYIPP